jgi:hypothetical protein
MDYKFVSIDRIFSKIVRDLGETSLNEGDIIEWVGEALEFIAATEHYEEAIAFIEVKEHQCKLPTYLHQVVQIARNNCWTGATDALCPKTTTEEATEDTASVPVALDCYGQPINDFDLAYYRPYFDLKWEHSFWYGAGSYKNCYTPVRLKNHVFFDSLVCPENDNLYTGNDEYTIINNDTLRFSFKEGFVAVTFNRQKLDPVNGYPMIPDNISYTTAITKYVKMMILGRMCYNGREGACSKEKDAIGDWHWYCKQATNVDMMPYGIDEHQNLLDQRNNLLPRNRRYYGFFGNLSKPEMRRNQNTYNGR